MLSHVRNGEAGRLRDVHALNNEELVSYGLAHHIVIADKRNELSRELAGRELLRNAHPDVEIRTRHFIYLLLSFSYDLQISRRISSHWTGP